MRDDMKFRTAVMNAIKCTMRQGRQSVDSNGSECISEDH